MLNFPVKFVWNKIVVAKQPIPEEDKYRFALVGAMIPGGILPSAVVTLVAAQRATPTSDTATPSVTPPGTPPGTPAPAQVRVPTVTGVSFDIARSTLQLLGLQAQRQDVLSTTVAKDYVISENPTADTTVALNTIVTLSVNPGVPVPDVTTQLITDAQSQLSLLGLIGQPVVSRSSDVVEKDHVISQNPVPRTLVSPVAPGNTVTLVVSSGIPLVDLPNVTNNTFAVAREILQNNRFGVKSVPDPAPEDGIVKAQEPLPGKVAPETTVTLTISSSGAPE